MKYFLVVICLIGMLYIPVSGQTDATNTVYEKGGFFLAIHSLNRGWGGEFTYLGAGESKRWIYSLDIYSMRSLHEVKIEPFPFRDLKYVFGKLNYFAVFRPSFGVMYDIAPQNHINLIGIQWGAKIGPSIGITNPYYIKVCDISGSNQSCDIVPFDPAEHSFTTIAGRANVLASPFNPTFYLGGGAQVFGILNFAASKSIISGIKVSLNVDAFTRKVPIMVESDNLQNNSVFLSGSVGFLIGNRW